MFGSWGRKGRLKQGVAALERGTDARSVLAGLPEREREGFVLEGVRQLMFDDRHDEARALVEAALVDPRASVDVLLAADHVFTTLGELVRSVEVCERALAGAPSSPRLVSLLAARLVDADRHAEAIEVIDVAAVESMDVEVQRARALVALERPDEARPILEQAIEHYDRELKAAMSEAAWQVFNRARQEAVALHDAIQAEAHGAESVIATTPHIRNLDARAGVNYRLLAESLMVKSSYRPDRTELRSPEALLAEVSASGAAQSAVARARRGEAALRLGKLGEARRAFEAACEMDGQCFAGYRGIGAVLDFERHELWQHSGRLPPLRSPAELVKVVPDWPALTERERAVVVASAHPLRALLPTLAACGASIRLLPIDVRTTDLAAWLDEHDARFADDHRAIAALGGVASAEHALAAARIEELLDVVSPEGFVFGHELAHLAYFHLANKAPVLALYERALEVPYVASSYQMSNEHEFFACAYQDYLRQRYALPRYRERDDEGVWDGVRALFDGLG